MSLFSGTAAYYRQFRSDVPESVAVVLDRAAPPRRPRRLLDLGTGTGLVIRALLSRFDEIVGVDTDPDLLAVAEEDLRPRTGEARLSLVLGRAEDFRPAPGWAADNPWKSEARAIVTEFLGDRRRAGAGNYREPKRSQLDYLAGSAFSDVQQVQVAVRRERTLESIVGYLHSTSFAAPHLFGDRLRSFDDTVRRRLSPLATAGIFVDDNQFDIFLARRP